MASLMSLPNELRCNVYEKLLEDFQPALRLAVRHGCEEHRDSVGGQIISESTKLSIALTQVRDSSDDRLGPRDLLKHACLVRVNRTIRNEFMSHLLTLDLELHVTLENGLRCKNCKPLTTLSDSIPEIWRPSITAIALGKGNVSTILPTVNHIFTGFSALQEIVLSADTGSPWWIVAQSFQKDNFLPTDLIGKLEQASWFYCKEGLKAFRKKFERSSLAESPLPTPPLRWRMKSTVGWIRADFKKATGECQDPITQRISPIYEYAARAGDLAVGAEFLHSVSSAR